MAVFPRFLRVVRRLAILTVVSFVLAAISEHLLEVLDATRLTTDETFCAIGERRVRYRFDGRDRPGPTTVLISGFGGTVEQWHDVEEALAASSPLLMYDRGGLGFSDPSDVHDPDGLADELADLLHAVHAAPPYVIVSYSSSALMARRFVAHHEADVKGVVLLDPILPKAQLVGGRVLTSMRLQSLVGLTRLKEHRRSHPGATRREEKEEAVLSSFHHWNATADEASNLGDWSPRLMAATPFEAIPVGVLCTFDETIGGRPEEAVANTRRLAAESPRGTFLPVSHASHSELLHDPAVVPVVVGLIEKVQDEVRALAGGQP